MGTKKDEEKTKEELIVELVELRKKLAEQNSLRSAQEDELSAIRQRRFNRYDI